MKELAFTEAPPGIGRRGEKVLDTRVYHAYGFDQQYVERLTRGDAETETHFTSHFGKQLITKLRSRLRSSELAKDVRQETFLRVLHILRNKGGIKNPERLGAFVNAVCENVVLETVRKDSLTRQWREKDREPPSPAISVESELISEERKAIIRTYLPELSEYDQAMLRQVFLEERDKDEICRELGIDRNNLRVRLHRAVRRFRAAMSAESTD